MIGNGGRAVEITPEGGLAYWVINDTGATSFKGAVVETSASLPNAVSLIGVGDGDPIGITYDYGISDGELIRVVFSGKAEVFFVGSVSLHQFARVTVAGDTGNEAGKAIAEVFPTPPFSTDKHFMEIGHVLESRAGAGLALINLHFN